MSNTHKRKKRGNRMKHLAKFLAIHAGILLLMETDIAVMSASVLHSGEGMSLAPAATGIAEHPATESVIKTADSLHSAAESGIGMLVTSQLVTSLLFVVLGFFLHVLWVSHKHNGERRVPITVKKRTKKAPAWYWIEMRV